ncbi:hypothetical protein GLOTRDRAFT_127867 [Gloeophyllum trabeum ATCC 11539]|uniref:N-acetyltransferase domain-containing protein n=1 Tax=Gloeophyllum trabeum (strain ATCC 11539 / FP-39264 / Madison 617) TaxID=670483 RepID=S7RSB8_GLOTA|nr:uncharacterized protein GLOTRDRAFT_127867 [Gloeophyllum trabeum ATCC 11539]EPQ57515.1 hypothetical protein GLOTRDRAFT_127867 [Gloeophyllum trabeum ATCC 11539]
MSSNATELFRADLTQPEIVGRLVELLKHGVPQSLPILGSLFHSSPPTAETIDGVAPKLYVWTSFDLNHADRPSLYSVVAYSPLDNNQARYFCSADGSSDTPTGREKKHVVDFLTMFLRHVNDQLGDSSNPTMFKIGSVHEKWVDTLRSLDVDRANPCTKYLRAPPGPGDALPDRDVLGGIFTISPLQPSDAESIISTSHISRSREYILSRSLTSICIRAAGADGSGGRPIAWALQHSDGSIGTLFVQPEYRGKGLARKVMGTLVNRLDQADAKAARGGALGWNWVDVVAGNTNAEHFFEGLQGWHRGWTCYWISWASLD